MVYKQKWELNSVSNQNSYLSLYRLTLGDRGLLYLSFLLLFASSCSQDFIRNKEAREDKEEMEQALNSQAMIANIVYATAETEAVNSPTIDHDAADDPAIWHNDKQPERSIVFGSNKVGGIHSYDLEGREIQYIACGKINNIDIRQDVSWGEERVGILAGSSRTDNSIVIFKIDPIVGEITTEPDYSIALGEFKPYGFCLYQGSDDLFAFVNNKDGAVFQLQLSFDHKEGFSSKVVRKLQLKTQVEGMVVDDKNHILYVGEEQAGIHIFSALPNGKAKGKLMQASKAKNNSMLRYDIEGLALLGDKYLIASSQGNFSFAIFDRITNNYISSFKITERGIIDGVLETDGIEVFTGSLGEKFRQGILVVQDGFNYENGQKLSQNFKLINLEQIYKIIADSTR